MPRVRIADWPGKAEVCYLCGAPVYIFYFLLLLFFESTHLALVDAHDGQDVGHLDELEGGKGIRGEGVSALDGVRLACWEQGGGPVARSSSTPVHGDDDDDDNNVNDDDDDDDRERSHWS
jgi:hypothetical protein